MSENVPRRSKLPTLKDFGSDFMLNLSLNSESELARLIDDVEPYFAYMQTDSLAYPAKVNLDSYLSHINYRILKNPASLGDHARKILLIQSKKTGADQLAAALADLFHVLKGGGYQLRKRFLLTSRDLIPADHFKKLVGKLKTGDLSTEERWLEALPTLMVEKSNVEVVGRIVDQEASGRLPDGEGSLSLANEYIENSQIELAIDTLEASITENPYVIEPALLLIELYERSLAVERFQTVYQKLQQIADEALPDCWQQAEEYFEQLSVNK